MTINGPGGTERANKGDETQRSSSGRGTKLPGAPSKYLGPLLSLDVQLVSPWIPYFPSILLINASFC